MRFADLSTVVAVIAIVLMMIIPLNASVLDVFLSLNITLSLLVLLLSMYTRKPLDFSIFPSLLLVLTLFRLALNVSSTRLILLHGYAGDVIAAFGEFVIQGSLVVGFVIFFILVVIQFVVITKGAERVAEVAARFTLDAMPGKQMAIDADLNAGLITEDEARQRRQQIQAEADFYGAMDGASKFVKGDAIAGIIITLVNVIGGLIVGVAIEGYTFSEALATYTLLTVGDGLVSQIPALLVSTATGIVVTRAASDSSMGEDLVTQFSSQPRTMVVTAVVMALMGSLTALPFLPFVLIAAVLGFAGYSLKQEAAQRLVEQRAVQEQQKQQEQRRPDSVLSLLKVDVLGLELGFGLLPLAEGEESELSERINVIRRQMAMELGLVVPVIRVRDNIQLDPNTYSVKLKGIEVAKGELLLDHLLAMDPGVAQDGIPGVETTEPAFGLPAKWIKEEHREKAEMFGYTVVDPPTVLATHLTEVIRRHAGELLSRQDVQNLIDLVKDDNPAVIEELVPDRLNIGQIQKVLVGLLREQVSIRNLNTIFETLADFAAVTTDTDMLVEYVRQALGREIVRQYVEPHQTMFVATLSPDLEQAIMDSLQRTESGNYLSVSPDKVQRIVQKVQQVSQLMLDKGQTPIILSSPGVRIYFRRLLEGVLPQVVVLSYNELDVEQEVQSVGVVDIE